MPHQAIQVHQANQRPMEQESRPKHPSVQWNVEMGWEGFEQIGPKLQGCVPAYPRRQQANERFARFVQPSRVRTFVHASFSARKPDEGHVLDAMEFEQPIPLATVLLRNTCARLNVLALQQESPIGTTPSIRAWCTPAQDQSNLACNQTSAPFASTSRTSASSARSTRCTIPLM